MNSVSSFQFYCEFLVDINIMLLLYNSLFLPFLSYCVEIWANTYNTKLKAIVTIQQKGCKNYIKCI